MKNIYTFKSVIFYFLMLIIPVSSFSQQDLMLTQYMVSLQPTNAGYVGTSGRLNATAYTRNQWVGFEGAPSSQILMINSPFIKHNIGVGLTLVHDQIGPLKQTLVFADIAYNFKISDKIKLSMGLKSGLSIQQPDISNVTTVDQNDPAYRSQKQTELLPNFGFGLYMYSKKFYVGLSTPKLMQNKTGDNSTQGVSGSEKRHYYLISGYLFELNPEWKLRPSLFAKMVTGAPISTELTANTIYKDKIWFGIMYRFGDAIGGILQYQVTKQFRVGYSYDFALSKMMKYNNGTHEIMLSYDMIFRDDRIVTPRYF